MTTTLQWFFLFLVGSPTLAPHPASERFYKQCQLTGFLGSPTDGLCTDPQGSIIFSDKLLKQTHQLNLHLVLQCGVGSRDQSGRLHRKRRQTVTAHTNSETDGDLGVWYFPDRLQIFPTTVTTIPSAGIVTLNCGVGSRQLPGLVSQREQRFINNRDLPSTVFSWFLGLDSPSDCSNNNTGLQSWILDFLWRQLIFYNWLAATVYLVPDPAAFAGPWSPTLSSASIDLLWKPDEDWSREHNPAAQPIQGVGSLLSSLLTHYNFAILRIFIFLLQQSNFLTWITVNLLLLAIALENFQRYHYSTHRTRSTPRPWTRQLNSFSYRSRLWRFSRSFDSTCHGVQAAPRGHTRSGIASGRNPGPKSGHTACICFLGVVTFCLMQMTAPFTWMPRQLYVGEGYGIQPWDSMGANFEASHLSNLLGAKLHGQPPIMGSGPVSHPTNMQNMTTIQKRSFKRAYARSLRDGVAWYKGASMTPSDFPAHMPMPRKPCPSRPAGVPTPAVGAIPHTHRLNVVQYNVGGLSTHKLEEIKQWGLCVKADIIVLLESRWSFTSEWSDTHWHAMHSGTQTDVADGILVLFRTTVFQTSQLGSAELISGRLVHIRLHYRQRACDLICCYNYADDRTTSRMMLRQQFWTAIDQCIGALPTRNMLLIAGDMNCSLEADDMLVGTRYFTWQGKHHRGPLHRDMHLFHKFLRKHRLTVLNSWNASDGPTFSHNMTASRIDFFIMRTADADGAAKSVKYLHCADILPLSGPTHVPLMCNIKKFQFSYKQAASFSGFTYYQRQQCRMDWRTTAPTWESMMNDTARVLQDLCSSSTADHDMVQFFHDSLGPCFHRYYPRQRRPVVIQPSGVRHDLIQQKWFYHRQVKESKMLTLSSIFHAWRCRSRYDVLNRAHKQQTKLLKKQRFFDLLTSVQQAAQHHDSFAVHQVISKYTPKQPKRRIQLRNASGAPATPAEALQLTKEFVESVWAGPAIVDLGPREPPGVPFTIEDLEMELRKLPHNKSVAKPFLPALVVKMHASIIAPWLHNLLSEWWSTSDPYVPALWKRAWVAMIPKPNKSPTKVGNLRCIALQEPLGKCVLGALTKKLQVAVGDTLQQWPQYAFLPMRSTGDAIRRVAAHCNEVRSLVKNQRRTAQQRAANVEFHECCGGLQIFLDIERAFDKLPRKALFEHLDRLHAEPALTTLMATWHSMTDYCIDQSGESVLVPTGCGVRQGCRAAPILWNCFLDQLFRSLAHQISPDWVKQTLTAFADDIHQGSIFRSRAQPLTEIQRVGLLLDTLESLGLNLSLEKSCILLEIVGTHCSKLKAKLLKYDGTQAYVEIPRAHGRTCRIPVKRTAAYLGTCLSYGAFEQQTFDKRVQCARLTFHRLHRWLCSPQIALRHRLQLWKASVLSTLTYGIVATNLTLPIIKQFQQIVYGMYRKLTRNHSFRTRETHAMVLQRYQLEHPVLLLRRHVQQLQTLHSQRAQNIRDTDILHMNPWDNLSHTQQLLQVTLEVQTPVTQPDDVTNEVPLQLTYACSVCSFVTTSLPNLRRHQTTMHGQPQFRTCLGHTMSCSVGGLPQCAFCFQSFTTWRKFQHHLDRQCCQVRPCDRGMNLDALLREEEEQRIMRLHQRLTPALQAKSYGDALVQTVMNRDWNGLADLRQACEALSTQCVICDFHFSRPQDLHVHLRVHHHKWIHHTFTKASQMCKGYASNSPCRYCSKSFRHAHACPVLTQVALLYLYLPSENGIPDLPPAAALRCEVCGLRADNMDDLHQHLASVHRLAFLDWQQERDVVGSNPACSHCSTLFTSVAAVRQHVTLGQCKEFDPNRSPYLLPIAEHWVRLLETGDLQPFLADSKLRMKMTLHCAQCGAAYMRSGDLILHMQTAHSAMWDQSQALTRYLLKVLMPKYSCVCNPSVHKVTLTHVCPFYRQIAMLAGRSAVELFLPWCSDQDAIACSLDHSQTQVVTARLVDLIHNRRLRQLLQDQALQAFLRERCVLCGCIFHPALLREHILQVHTSKLEPVADLLPFLYEEFQRASHTDYQCAQCNQIFNLPLLGSPPLAEQQTRQTLVVAHYQQCPVVHQICLLLTHGITRDSGHDRQGDPGAPGDVCGDGSITQQVSHETKRRRTRLQEGQDAAPTSRTTGQSRSTKGRPADGTAHDQDGCRPESSEKARLLRLLHANGGGISDPHPECEGQAVASGDDADRWANAHDGMDAPSGDTDADPGRDASAATSQAVLMQADGPFVPDGHPAQLSECQRGVLLSEVGCHQPEAGANEPSTSGHGQNETLRGSAGGQPEGTQQCGEIPLPEECGGPKGHALDSPSVSALRRAADPFGAADRMQGLELVGSHAQSAFHSAEQPSGAVEGHAGQRERDGERQASAPMRPLDDATRAALQAAIGTLSLGNDGNHCYINAAMMATLWAIVCRTDLQMADLGPQANPIVACLLTHQGTQLSLAMQPWFEPVLQSWHNPNNQGDPVEFLSHALGCLQFGGFNMKWERRVQIHDTIRLMDQSTAVRPLTVQFDGSDPTMESHGYTHLQYLIDSWEGQYGMQSALTEASSIVCIHVDRFINQGTHAVTKSERPIFFRGSFSLPFFDDDSMSVSRKGYQMISAIAHLGTDGQGHCRSILKTWPDPITFLLTDDGRPPEIVWAEPSWFQCNVSSFWLCDCAYLDLVKWPVQAMRPADPAAAEISDDVPLQRLFRAMSKT